MIAYLEFVLTDLAFRVGRPVASVIMELLYDVTRFFPQLSAFSMRCLTTSFRFYPRARNHKKIIRIKDDLGEGSEVAFWSGRDFNRDAVIERVLVLKNPGRHNGRLEKGVLLVKYTETFEHVFGLLDCQYLERYFSIVLEPSWSGYALPEIHCWMSLKSPILIESSEQQDFDYIESLKSNLVPVRFGSSDWVDERIFHPFDGEKKIEFDSIYIANFNRMKRHHAYLRALAKIADSSYRAALVCGAWGEHQDKVNKMIRYFGLEDVVECFVQLPQSDLNELLNRSRLNVLMSLKEGSNRTIFEGLFADTPGLVLAENIGVNKSYINEHTGYLIPESHLAEVLAGDRDSALGRFRPREWAMENISVHKTTGKLNEYLSELAKQAGEPWTEDAVAKVNAPEAVYYDTSAADTLWDGQKLLRMFEKGKVDAEKIESRI